VITHNQFVKAIVFICLVAPLCWLGWQISLELQQPGSALGADPGEAIVHYLGEWSIRILLFAFSITPLRRLLKSRALARTRRMVGLFAFTYVVMHLLAYLFFYLEFNWSGMWVEILERPYITVGMLALACLLPMAITSTGGWQRRLGRNWRLLHRMIYAAITLALIHLWWLTKDGFEDLVVYTLWFMVLLWFRWRNVSQQLR